VSTRGNTTASRGLPGGTPGSHERTLIKNRVKPCCLQGSRGGGYMGNLCPKGTGKDPDCKGSTAAVGKKSAKKKVEKNVT